MSTPIGGSVPSHALADVGLDASLEPGIQGASSRDTPSLEASPMHRSNAASNRLLEQIGEALQANLARGYLEGEERIRDITEALHDVVALIDSTGSKVLLVNPAYEEIW